MKKTISYLLITLLFVTASVLSETEVTFGSVAMDIPAEMHKRLKPLTEYLAREINIPVKLNLSPNMKDAIEKVSSDNVDIAYLTPVAYIKSHNRTNSRLIVKTKTKQSGSFRLMIVTRSDSDINNVNDLKGKIFAFGDKAALLQRAIVIESGINLNEFSEYQFLGHYENIARGVFSGDFDAGILKDTKAFAWKNKGLKIIYESAPLPPYNIVATSKVSDSLYKKLQAAFLKLDINNPEHAPVIQSLSKKYTGFLPTSDKEYNIIRKLVKNIKK